MIDIEKARQVAAEYPKDIIPVSRKWLAQAVAEIASGREACDKLKLERRPALDLVPVTPR